MKTRSDISIFWQGALLLACLFTFSSGARAQDTVRLRDGNSLITQIVEVGDNYFLYKNRDGDRKDSIDRFSRESVLSIKYKGGYEEVINKPNPATNFDTLTLVNTSTILGKILEVQEKAVSVRTVADNKELVENIGFDSIANIHYSNGYTEKYNDVAVKTISGTLVTESSFTNHRPDTLVLLKGGILTGYVTEIGDESIKLASLERSKPGIADISKSEITRVVYGNGYIENYAAAAPVPEAPRTAGAKPAAPKTAPTDPPVPDAVANADVPKKQDSPAAAERKEAAVPALPAVKYSFFDEETLKKLPAFFYLPANTTSANIRSLHLEGKSLGSLDDRVTSLRNLLVLDLSRNNFKEVPAVVYDIPSLYQLRVDNCQLKDIGDIPANADSDNLALVSFTNNKISSVDGNFFSFPNLKKVDLSYNQIKNIHKANKRTKINTTIQVIDLSNNRLKEIPPVISRVTGLSALELGHNMIQKIDYGDFTLKNLEMLDLSYNPIADPGKELYDIRTLKYLNLTGTLITDLSDSIAKLTALNTLLLPDKLRSLPPGIRNNKELKVLELADNPNFSSFPQALLNLTRLESLNFNGTKIHRIPDEIDQLKRLKLISFSNCGLSSVPPGLFSLPRLQRVDLSQNNIRSIPGELGNLAQLELLNLENSPVDESSLMKLKKAIPYAYIKYYSPELGLNYESKPLSQDAQKEFLALLTQYDGGNMNACYQLGELFEKNDDYGYALSVFYRLAYVISAEGTAQHAIAASKIAEIYDDAGNSKSYNSIYKRKEYENYNDYTSSLDRNKALNIYCKVCTENAADNAAYQVMQKACARASIVYEEMRKNLLRIFEKNASEIERLIGGAGNMGQVGAGGDYMMNTATTEGQVTLGAALSIFGKVAQTTKESKAAGLQQENLRLKEVIEDLQNKAKYYIEFKP